MPKVVWVITVVDHIVKRWPAAQSLTRLGAQPTTIARYTAVQRTMTAGGLRKKLRDQQN